MSPAISKRAMRPTQAQMIRLIPKALMLIPAALLGVYLAYYAVDLPISDQWNTVRLLRASVEGNIHGVLSSLVAQYNQYRPVVPRLFFLVLFWWTEWDTRAEMWMSALVCVGIFMLVLALMRRAGVSQTLPVVISAWVCFSLGQSENILWGWQLAVYLQVFFGLAALYALSSESLSGTIVAGLLAFIAMFTYQVGMAIWLAGWVYIVLRRRPLAHSLAWGGFFVLAVLAQYSSYVVYDTSRRMLLDHHDPLRFLAFFLMNVGAPLAVQNEALSALMGAFILSVLLAGGLLLWRNRCALPVSREFVITASIVAMSLSSSLLITLGRYKLGLDWAVISRYTTVTALGVIGMLMLAYQAKTHYPGRFSARLPVFVVIFVIAGLCFSYARGILAAEEYWQARMKLRFVIQTMDFDHPDYSRDLRRLKTRMEFLEKHQLSMYREPPLVFIPKEVDAKAAGAILPSHSLVQTFQCPVQSLHDFKLPFADYGRRNTATLQVALRRGGEEIFRQTVPMQEIQPNSWVTFNLPKPIDDCFGQELVLELSSQDADPDNTVTVWTFPATYPVVHGRTSPSIYEGYAIGLKLNYVRYRLSF